MKLYMFRIVPLSGVYKFDIHGSVQFPLRHDYGRSPLSQFPLKTTGAHHMRM